MDHSPIGLFLFSLIFYSHFSSVFDDIERLPIGILDRSRLLSGTDKCVLKYLNGLEPVKSLNLLPFVLKRCALPVYFSLEEYGNQRNGSSLFTFFPMYQHPHLKKCHSFLFFGTFSYEMTAELEILKSIDFQKFDCKYLVIDKRKISNGLRHFTQVPELSELHLNDIMMQYKDDKDFVIDHLFIAEIKEIDEISEKILNFRKIYSVLPCQITLRFPHFTSEEKLWKFAENVLEDENYILLNVKRSEKFTEFYMLASSEYQCMMRYV